MLTLWNAHPALRRDRVFDDVVRDVFGSATIWTPTFETVYEDNAIRLTADLPGVKAGDLDVSIQGSTLTVKGERKDRKASFSKSYTLSERLDTENMTATLEDGVLTVILPKTPKAQPRRIPVTVSDST